MFSQIYSSTFRVFPFTVESMKTIKNGQSNLTVNPIELWLTCLWLWWVDTPIRLYQVCFALIPFCGLSTVSLHLIRFQILKNLLKLNIVNYFLISSYWFKHLLWKVVRNQFRILPTQNWCQRISGQPSIKPWEVKKIQ